MKSRFASLGLMLFVFFTFFSCENIESVQVTGIDNVEVVSSEDGKTKLMVGFMIDNPIDAKIKVKTILVDVFYGEVKLGQIVDEVGFELDPAVHKSYPIPVVLDMEQLKKDRKKLLKSLFSEGNTLRFVGNIKVGTLIFNKNIRVNHESGINIIDSIFK